MSIFKDSARSNAKPPARMERFTSTIFLRLLTIYTEQLCSCLFIFHYAETGTALDEGLEIMDHNCSEANWYKREGLLHYGNYQAYGDVCAMGLFPFPS